MSPIERLAGLFRACRRDQVLVVTGAGISLASGIPTFRGADPGAIWKKDVTELGTFRYFTEDPVGSWSWYLSRFEKTMGARPNPAHTALVELERYCAAAGGELLLVTQNIDGLHRQAGSTNLIEVHGRADWVRCPRDGCPNGAPSGSLPRTVFDLTKLMREPVAANLPRCPACDSVMRQHVLWFDECYDSHEDYQWSRVVDAASSCTAVLFVGTSFSVGVTELILSVAHARFVPVFSIDPSGEPIERVISLSARAEELLPAVVEAISSSDD
jgi:NAD-dependent deacetylase